MFIRLVKVLVMIVFMFRFVIFEWCLGVIMLMEFNWIVIELMLVKLYNVNVMMIWLCLESSVLCLIKLMKVINLFIIIF